MAEQIEALEAKVAEAEGEAAAAEEGATAEAPAEAEAAPADCEAAGAEAEATGAELDEFGQEIGAVFDEAGNRVPSQAEVAAAAEAEAEAAAAAAAEAEAEAAAAAAEEAAADQAAKADQARAAGPTSEDTDAGKKKKQNINERATVVAAQHMRGTLAVSIFPRMIDALPQSACVGGTFERGEPFWRDAEVLNVQNNDDGVPVRVEFKITSGDEKGETATVEVDSPRLRSWEIQSEWAPTKWLVCEIAEKKHSEVRVTYTGWRSADDAKYEDPKYKRSQWIKHSAGAPSERLRSKQGFPTSTDADGGGGCCVVS